MIKMKTLLKGMGLASAMTMALAASHSMAATTLKLGHAAPASDLQQTMSEYFKKEVESRSNGDLKINIFPHGQLGSDSQMIEGTRMGIMDFTINGLSLYSGLLPESSAFTLPFMFPDRKTAYKVLDGKVGKSVLHDMEKLGLKGLGFPENGFRNITNNRGPIREPSDLDGLRMRVNGSAALSDMFEILGANPTQMPVSELYTALETGVVNAQDHPIPIVLSFKFYELQKYLSLTRHSYSPLVLAMNLKKLNSLSDENQKIILDAANDAVAMQRKLSIEKEDKMIAELESYGMKVNRDVDSDAFREAVKPVWTNFINQYGDKMVNEILAASKE